MTDPIDTARQEGFALGLAMAAQKAQSQRWNINVLTSMPPQSAAAWEIEQAILALAPIPPHVAAARVLLDAFAKIGTGTEQVNWPNVWIEMANDRQECGWNDWPSILHAALEQIAKEGE